MPLTLTKLPLIRLAQPPRSEETMQSGWSPKKRDIHFRAKHHRVSRRIKIQQTTHSVAFIGHHKRKTNNFTS
jgi:hypothetical protein